MLKFTLVLCRQRIFLFFSFIEFKFGSDIFEKLNSIKGRIKDPAKVIVHMYSCFVIILGVLAKVLIVLIILLEY